jgi:ribosome-associated toxin RatA of RatAB toxin-antitoxin module
MNLQSTGQRLNPRLNLGDMPAGRAMETLDERLVQAPVPVMFELVRDVERWPELLAHYRFVRFREKSADGGGIVEMSANRPFGVANWPTWWLSEMEVDNAKPAVRFRHIGGVTKEMDVEWSLTPTAGGTHVRLVHVWDGPRWPLIGVFAATAVIGPVFIHGIASRTLEGLARVAERSSRPQVTGHRPQDTPSHELPVTSHGSS